MSQLTLYWNIGSQPARAIKTLIDIGRIPCNFVTVDMLRLEQRDQSYLNLYSMGKVPIIKDGDFVLGQSGAIMIYLCEKYPIIAKYHGQTIEQKAVVNQYIYWYQNYFRLAMIKPLRMYLGSYFTKKPILQDHKNALWNSMYQAIQKFDEILAKNGTKFITGASPTIADFLFFYEMTNLQYFGQDHQKYPQIKRWFSDVHQISQVKDITNEWNPQSKQLYGIFLKVQAMKSKL